MTATTSKPKTTMTGTYVIQRIEARMASLRSKIDEANTRLNNYARDQSSAVDSAFSKNLDILTVAYAESQEINRQYDDENDMQKRRVLAQKMYRLADGMVALPTTPTPHNYFVNWNGRPTVPGTLNAEQQIAQDQYDIVQWQGELLTLDHTLAYLRESPVEEYSITSLQKLGLMDAVKFSIPTGK